LYAGVHPLIDEARSDAKAEPVPGLEQEFNSLQAQREACEALIAKPAPRGLDLPRHSLMTTAGSPARRSIGRLSNGCSPTSRPVGSIRSLSTRRLRIALPLKKGGLRGRRGLRPAAAKPGPVTIGLIISTVFVIGALAFDFIAPLFY
jgi:hypothetical protein